MSRTAVADLRSGGTPLSGQRMVIDRVLIALGVVLHRAAGQPGCHGQPDGLGDARWIIGEAVLQIRGYRQIGALGEPLRMAAGLVPAHRSVDPPECRVEAAACGGELLES